MLRCFSVSAAAGRIVGRAIVCHCVLKTFRRSLFRRRKKEVKQAVINHDFKSDLDQKIMGVKYYV